MSKSRALRKTMKEKVIWAFKKEPVETPPEAPPKPKRKYVRRVTKE